MGAEEQARRKLDPMTSIGTQASAPAAPPWWSLAWWNLDGVGDWIPAIGLSALMMAVAVFICKHMTKSNRGRGKCCKKGSPGKGGSWGSESSSGKAGKGGSGSKTDIYDAKKKKLPC